MTEPTYAEKLLLLLPIIEHAAEDVGFRAKVRKRPDRIVETLAGHLPASATIEVLEDEPLIRHIVLPFLARPVDEEIAALSRLPASESDTRDFLTRAFREPEFRQRAQRDPRSALLEVFPELDKNILTGLDLRVMVETVDRRYVVLTPEHRVGGEISDTELEMIAGGASGGDVIGGAKRVGVVNPNVAVAHGAAPNINSQQVKQLKAC